MKIANVKVDIGAENTFTREDLELLIQAVDFYERCALVDDVQTSKCVRLLSAALEKLKPQRTKRKRDV